MAKICLQHPNIPYLVIDLNGRKKCQFNDLDPIDKKIKVLNLVVLKFNNIDIFGLLLNQPNIDINMKSIQIIKRYDDSKFIRIPLHNHVIMGKKLKSFNYYCCKKQLL